MTPSPLVVIDNVEKAYSREGTGEATPVLRGVSLNVLQGEFVSLMGASGSGKTTLLNLIGGIDTPDRGRIRVCDTSIHDLGDNARSLFRLRNIGFVFQFFNLLPNLSVRENIALPLLFLGENERRANSEAEIAAAEVGLAEKTHRMAHQLSGGEMQRVGIARALVHRPKLLLADEPTGNLDSKNGAMILELLHTVGRTHDLTIIMATHDLAAADTSDRIVRMVDGRIDNGAIAGA